MTSMLGCYRGDSNQMTLEKPYLTQGRLGRSHVRLAGRGVAGRGQRFIKPRLASRRAAGLAQRRQRARGARQQRPRVTRAALAWAHGSTQAALRGEPGGLAPLRLCTSEYPGSARKPTVTHSAMLGPSLGGIKGEPRVSDMLACVQRAAGP